MDQKQWLILITGIAGILLVVLSDRADLFARIALIIGVTVWGLWIVQKLPRLERRRKHWILIILVTFCFFLGAHIHTAGDTFGK
jgi:putative copper export protein